MKKLWDLAEIKAIEYLKENNYEIVTTNFKYGRVWEIDIIWKKERKVIFFEVKYRSSDAFWLPEESITYKKRKKLSETINYYCYENAIDMENIAFEVISIQGNLSWNIGVKHYKNVSLEF